MALAVGIILLLLALAAFLIQKWENKTYAVSVDRSESSAILDNASFPEITNGGITYAAKSSTEAYLVMGIDVSGPVVSVPGAYNGGQADALFLVVLDNEAKTWQLLRLNRDSMVDVPVLDLRGDVISSWRWPTPTAMEPEAAAKIQFVRYQPFWAGSRSMDMLPCIWMASLS